MSPRKLCLGLLLAAVVFVSIPACSSRTRFPSENAAKSALVGKTARDVVSKLGAPDSVNTTTNFETPNRYTESWKYSMMVRDRSGNLKALNIYLLRGRVVAVGAEK